MVTFDAVSFIFLLLMHSKNFNQQGSKNKLAKLQQVDQFEDGLSQVISDSLNHCETNSDQHCPSIQEIKEDHECGLIETDTSKHKLSQSHSRSTFKLLDGTLLQSSRSFQETARDESMLVDSYGMILMPHNKAVYKDCKPASEL